MNRRFRFASRSIAVAALVMLGGVPAHAAGLPRIASINLCTDQLLLPLADPAQILGLSRFSHDALAILGRRRGAPLSDRCRVAPRMC